MSRHIIPLFILSLLFVCPIIVASSPAAAQIGIPPRECNIDIGDIGTGPPDPGAEGPFLPTTQEYGAFDQDANLPDFDDPVELLAEVTYPFETECGPFPIVFMMHGSHATCVEPDGGVRQNWPCDPDQTVLPNYQGYRYLAEILASRGFVVVSFSANGINAADETNLEARARLFQRHFGLWVTFSTTGSDDFGSLFVGKIDLKRVGLLGHSRGGGAVARLLDLMAQNDSPFDTLGSRGGGIKIKAAMLVGAVRGSDEDHIVTKTPLAVVLPYCDGDQTDLPSVAYFDASRYAVPGNSGALHSFLVIGANHNKFNTLWDPDENMMDQGAIDDWATLENAGGGPFCQPDAMDNGRLSSEEQQGTLIATASAFFRRYLRNEKAFLPFLRGDAEPPPSAMTDLIFVGYLPKDEPEERLDVNRLTTLEETTINTLGGMVDNGGLVRFEFCDPAGDEEPPGCVTAPDNSFFTEGRKPHAFSDAPVSQLRLAWDLGGPPAKPAFINELPEGYRDISRYRAFQFRAFVDYTDPLNPFGQAQNLRVVLRDGAGLSASVPVADHSPALFFPPSVNPYDMGLTDSTAIPRAVLNTVRVPLSAFQNLFLTDVRSVQLVFDQTESGAINIADLAFADEAQNGPPQLACSVAEAQLMSGGDKLVDIGLSLEVMDEEDGGLQPTLSVYSDEDDLDSENNQSSPDAKDIAANTLRLRAERDKNGDGRVYLIVATAADDDGLLGRTCCTATVPLSKKQEDIDDANAQAADALDLCTSFAAANEGLADSPTGYFLVGDGPTIGPNQ